MTSRSVQYVPTWENQLGVVDLWFALSAGQEYCINSHIRFDTSQGTPL